MSLGDLCLSTHRSSVSMLQEISELALCYMQTLKPQARLALFTFLSTYFQFDSSKLEKRYGKNLSCNCAEYVRQVLLLFIFSKEIFRNFGSFAI